MIKLMSSTNLVTYLVKRTIGLHFLQAVCFNTRLHARADTITQGIWFVTTAPACEQSKVMYAEHHMVGSPLDTDKKFRLYSN